MWNYKTALLSACVRAAVFFTATLNAGAGAATGAMLAEFSFRFVASGFYGALTQAFRRVEPRVVGTVGALLLVPALGHAGEFVVHSWRGTPNLMAALSASVLFTCVSTAFNLFAMR